jgi:hypothetical protein
MRMSAALVIQYARRTYSASCYIVVCCRFVATVFFPHNHINGTNFGKYIFENKMCCKFLLSETFLILRSIQRNIVINSHRLSSKILTIPLRLPNILEFFDRLSKSFQKPKTMCIRPEATDFFKADRRKGRRIYTTDEVGAVFSQSCECI